MIKFSDGMKFNTSTPTYRVELRSDGYYVVGRGMLCPVDTREEGQALIEQLTKGESK